MKTVGIILKKNLMSFYDDKGNEILRFLLTYLKNKYCILVKNYF